MVVKIGGVQGTIAAVNRRWLNDFQFRSAADVVGRGPYDAYAANWARQGNTKGVTNVMAIVQNRSVHEFRDRGGMELHRTREPLSFEGLPSILPSGERALKCGEVAPIFSVDGKRLEYIEMTFVIYRDESELASPFPPSSAHGDPVTSRYRMWPKCAPSSA
jgi:hypothetical protein